MYVAINMSFWIAEKKGSDLSIAKAEESALFTKYYSEWKGIDNTYKNEPALYVKVSTTMLFS